MIGGFIDSWALFHNTYLAGWCIAVLLSLIGVVVVARDQIFIGAAVSQASMLGIAVGMWAGNWGAMHGCEWCDSDNLLSLWGSGFAVFGALLTTRGARRGGRESHEAITGWLFLLSASLAVLVMSRSPHGLEEVHRLLSSTIIGAIRIDVLIFAGLMLVTIAAIATRRDTLALLITDPEMAGAVGVRVGLWDTALSVWLGITIGMAIRVSGMIYTFGCLVLPALIAKNVCREVRSLFVAAPVLALLLSTAAFLIANDYDFPPGQVCAALQAAALVVAWGWRARRA